VKMAAAQGHIPPNGGQPEFSTSVIRTDRSAVQTINRDRLRFLTRSIGPGYNTSWIGVRQLGRGGQGRVGLWIRRDRYRNIAENMCVKEVDFRTSWAAAHGAFPNVCWGRLQHPVNQQGWPIEIEAGWMMDALVPNSEHIVRLRAYQLNIARQSYRIMSEYCPHGSLHDLIMEYAEQDQQGQFIHG